MDLKKIPSIYIVFAVLAIAVVIVLFLASRKAEAGNGGDGNGGNGANGANGEGDLMSVTIREERFGEVYSVSINFYDHETHENRVIHIVKTAATDQLDLLLELCKITQMQYDIGIGQLQTYL